MRERPGGQDDQEPGAGDRLRTVRTDLAIEQLLAREGGTRLAGVRVQTRRHGEVDVCHVEVLDEEGEQTVGKPKGHYVTLDAAGLRQRNTAVQELTARLLADVLRELLKLGPKGKVFVVGLGNWHATPDALGPKVVGELLVTRHLEGQVPADLAGDLRSLAAMAPGVLGITGIETGEIVRGVVDRVKPDVVIAVDALASRSIDRILRTIQVADTGIQPGSGVGNHRAGLNRESLGVPVVAVGVPTVVHAATIASDTIDLLAARMKDNPAYQGLAAVTREERHRLMAEVLASAVGELMVTPKEIDALVDDLAKVIAAGINAAVHPKIAQQPTLF